jgi:hypothetical protein
MNSLTAFSDAATRIVTLPLVAGILILSLGSARASVGQEGAAFLEIPVGAQPAALGSAYTALATDAYAPVWNPAGVARADSNQLAGQHLSYLEAMNYEFLSFVHPLAQSRDSSQARGIGFSAQYLASGNIAGTDVNGNSIGNFTSHFASYNLSYGQTLTEKVSVGVTGKLINAAIDNVSANAYAGDLGAMVHASDRLNLGATLTNLGTKLKFLNTGDSLPMAFHLGGAYRPMSNWMVTAEGEYAKTGLASFHGGLEWRPLDLIALRAGYKTDTLKGLSPVAGVTAGMGLYVFGQEFAYAYAPYSDLGSAQYFSLLIKFGAKEEQKRNLIQYQQIKEHRTVQNNSEPQPEYQELMQLLSTSEEHVAQNIPTSD